MVVDTKRRLVTANAVLVAMAALHYADHARQGRPLHVAVHAVGLIGVVVLLAPLVLSLRRHPAAAAMSAAVGAVTAVSVAAIHLAPYWSVFSDPYSAADLDAVSWAIMLAQLAAALGLMIVGLVSLHPRPGVVPSTPQVPH